MSLGSQFSFSIMSELFDPELQQELNDGLASQDLQLLYNLDLLPETAPAAQMCESDVGAPVQDEPASPVEQKVVIGSVLPCLIPTAASEIISTEDHEGSLLFGISVLSDDKSKNQWVFSPKLNKVFMEMDKFIPVDFKVENPTGMPLFIRTTLQYSAQEFANEPVMRCVQHDFVDDVSNQDIQDHVRSHVVRCCNKYAFYIGNCKAGERPSLVFPLSMPQPGSHIVRELLKFVCKSSCAAPGMNRREVDVIFTLEDEKRTVMGRRSLKVKVCACPKRDKEKEEKKLDKAPSKHGKRKKQGHSSTCEPARPAPTEDTMMEYSLKIRCIGKKTVEKVLAYVEDVNRAQLYDLREQPVEHDRVKQNLHDVLNLKQSLNLK